MNSTKTIAFTIKRVVPASPSEVYDAWLSSEVPGTPWNLAQKFILDPKIDGLFFWQISSMSHYGRFTDVERGSKLRHTWVSPNTLGRESIVTVSFDKHGADTLMTLIHSDIPDTEDGRGHEKGWNSIVAKFADSFTDRFPDARSDHR